MCSMIKKESIIIGNDKKTELHYYTREMCGYNSHVFIVVWDSEVILDELWKKTDFVVALKYQSNNEVEIERSNYYICHVLNSTVSKELKRTIEQDTFCAKKYVIENNSSSIEQVCSEIEGKIFEIDLPVINNVEKAKLRKIEIKNFRGYNGEFEFNLLDKNEKPASFVVIYAPNGIGKTSLFDGIEYALKGEVEYLKEVVQNSKFKKGVIYHNKDRQTDNAFVKLVLDNGGEIIRNVGKPDEDGTDLRVITPIKGKEIVGKHAVSSKWNRIILPFAKIEKFISAKNPEERYDEWLNNIPELDKERSDFENKNKELKALRDSIKDANIEFKKLEREANALKNKEDSINATKQLIIEFNNLGLYENEKLPVISTYSIEEDLNSLQNNISVMKRKLNAEKEQLVEEIEIYKKIDELGFEYCKNRCLYINSARQQVNNYLIMLREKDKISTLEHELDAALRKDESLKEIIQKYEEIQKKGKDEIIKTAKYYLSLFDKRKGIMKSLGSLKAELEEIELQIDRNEDTKLAYERVLKTRKQDLYYIITIEALKEKEKTIIKSIHDNKESLNEINKRINYYNSKLNKYSTIKIPQSIDNWNRNHVYEWGIEIVEELLAELDALYEEHATNTIQILEIENKASRSEQIFNYIKELGRQLQTIDSSNCNCPLCKSRFNAPKELFDRINDYSIGIQNNDDLNKLYNKEIDVDSRFQVLRKQIKEIVEKQENGVQAQIKAQYAATEQVNNCIKEQKNNLSKVRLDIELRKTKINNKQLRDIESFAEANLFFSDIRKDNDLLNHSINTLNKKGNDLYEDICLAANKLDETNYQIRKCYNNPRLMEYVEFLKGIDFEFDINYEKLSKQIEKNKKEINRISGELINNKKSVINELSEDQIQNMVSMLKKELKAEESFYNDFGEYTSLDWSQYNENKRGVIKKINDNKMAIELLNQIKEERGIREYIKNYRQVCKKMDLLRKKVELSSKRIEEITDELLKVQNDLEKKLGQYFGKTIMDDIYKKIDPHEDMKQLSYHISYNEKSKGELYITLNDRNTNKGEYRPEIYFSTAQLNTVAFSSFISRALDNHADLALNSIFIDDPVCSFDEMNVLGFADLIRSIIETSNHQIMISTHDEKVFRILKRKLNENYYSSCFLALPQGNSSLRYSHEEKNN